MPLSRESSRDSVPQSVVSKSSNWMGAWAGQSPFDNMSRDQVREWKNAQAKVANQKIAKLETRLKRLHQLDEKLQETRTAETQDVLLPGAVAIHESVSREQLRQELQTILDDEETIFDNVEAFSDDSGDCKAKNLDGGAGQTTTGLHKKKASAGDAGWAVSSVSPSCDDFASVESYRAGVTSGTPNFFRSGVNPTAQPTSMQRAAAALDVTSEEAEPDRGPWPFCSLFACSEISVLRHFCIVISRSPTWNTFFFVVNLANCIYIAMAPSLFGDVGVLAQASWSSDGAEFWAVAFDLFCVVVLGFEVLVGSVASAPPRKSWLLRAPPHRLELFVLVVCGLEYLASALGARGITLRPLRLLRVIRVLSRLEWFQRARIFVVTLREGALQVAMVFSLFLFFTCTFSILGMAILQKSFRRYCVVPPRLIPACTSGFATNWTAACDLRLFDTNRSEYLLEHETAIAIHGGFPYEQSCKVIANSTAGQYDGEYNLDGLGRYHTCPGGEMCEELGNPGLSFSHFDHIGGAMLTMFQSGIPDSYYDVIHRSLNAEPRAALLLWLIWWSVTCVLTFLILGLFIAVVTGTYGRVSDAHAELQQPPTEAFKHHLTRGHSRRSVKNLLGQPASTSALRRTVERLLPAAAILTHFVAMASDQHDASDAWRDLVTWVYVGCNACFALELLARFVSARRRRFFWSARPSNAVEAVLLACGVLGIVLNERLLLFIPALRLYRLMQFLPTLEHLLMSAVASTPALCDLVLFVAFLSFCFTVTGRYLLGSSMDALTRSNFGSLWRALLTMFQLFTGDSWSSVLYSAMASQQSALGQALAACFVLSWLFLSTFVFYNLFIGVIIQNFQIAEVLDNITKPGVGSSVRSFVVRAWRGFPRHDLTQHAKQSVADTLAVSASVQKAAIRFKDGRSDAKRVVRPGSLEQMVRSYRPRALAGSPPPKANKTKNEEAVVTKTEKEEEEDDNDEIVLLVFHKTNYVRRALTWLGEQAFFEIIVYLTIIASFVVLVLTPPYQDMPGNPPPIDSATADQLATAFTYIFTAEFLVRSMSRGLMFTRHAYLKNGWDRLDCLILVFSWVEELRLVEGGISKAARVARAFSPLRAMKRNEGMKKVIDALLRTLHPVAYVVFFSVITFTVFAVMGMGFFGGRFFRCSAPDVLFPWGKAECSGVTVDVDTGVVFPRAWARPPQNFDSIYYAMMTLFQVSTVKYVKVLESAMDVTELGVSPELNHSPGFAGYFVVYIIVGSLFTMNLFVGFIVDGFNVNHGRTKADQLFQSFVRNLKAAQPSPRIAKPPRFIVAGLARRLEASRQFQLFSAGCILINTSLMLTEHAEHDGGPDDHELFRLAMDVQNAVFYAELVFEICVYLVGQGPACFVRDAWKSFDLAVAAGLSFGYVFNQAEFGQFTKACRMLRIVRLVRMLKPIKIVLETFISSLPQLANVLLLLFLVYAIFAAVAMRLFGAVKFGTRLGPTANFENWGSSMVAIYQIVTGDEWMDLMEDCSVQPPACTERFEGFSFGDCGSVWAPAFFLTLKVVCEAVMLNLFIGMILDNFLFFNEDAAIVEDPKWVDGASAAQVDELAAVFCRFDAGTAQLALSSLHSFLCSLPQPLGFRAASGELHFGARERRVEKIIRSELNLIVLRNKTKKAPQSGIEILLQWGRAVLSGLWRRLTGTREFSSSAGFQDVMLTLLYWRKPSMVPGSVSEARGPLMEHVLRMAHRLTVLDFFQRLVIARRKARMRLHNAAEIKFHAWARADPHELRRIRLHARLNAGGIDARRMRIKQPAATQSVRLLDLIRTPSKLIAHQQALRTAWPSEVAKCSHGHHLFLGMAARARVVLRFRYPRIEGQPDVIVDMRQATWAGWEVRSLREDMFWEPQTAREWERVDLELVSLSPEERSWAGGSLLDVQSSVQVVDEDSDDEGGEREPDQESEVRSVVRLNVGTHTRKVVGEGVDGAAWKLEQCNTVLEVIGYLEVEANRRGSVEIAPSRPGSVERWGQTASPRRRSQMVLSPEPMAPSNPVAQVEIDAQPPLSF